MKKNKFKCYLPYEYDSNSYDSNSFYKSMFIDDIVTGIIPIRLNSNEDTIKITIYADEENLKLAKNILNSFNTYSEIYNIEEELVKHAIEGIARDISWYGDAVYEIYEEHENDEKQIKFINLIPDKFVNFKFFYIQLAPKNKLPRLISKKILWKISIPKNLQTKYSYKRILSAIDKFDNIMPRYFEDELYKGNNSLYNYDSKSYREKQYLYVNNLTSEWGWNQRSMSDEYTTEFFRNYKYLKFKLSQAIFREHIIEELNSLFKKLEINVLIKLDGIPSSKDYEEHLEKFIKNEISYEDIFNVPISNNTIKE